MTWGTKNMPPKKNLSKKSLSNWCDAEADADSIKTICRPPPYYTRGGEIDTIKYHVCISVCHACQQDSWTDTT